MCKTVYGVRISDWSSDVCSSDRLKLDDGTEVLPGDSVILQDRGVKWSDGEEFDASWSRGEPSTFESTQGVVEAFRQALEGHTVGSQVLVVAPPAAAYGATEGPELQNKTLVFVSSEQRPVGKERVHTFRSRFSPYH